MTPTSQACHHFGIFNVAVYEGGTGTYTVQLDTEPTGTVTVTVNDPTNTDVTTEPGTLAFTPDNWDEPADGHDYGRGR